MAETPNVIKPQVDREQLAKLGRDLADALGNVGAMLTATGKRMREANEVAALFALYRLFREAEPSGHTSAATRQMEHLERLHAALEGYEPAYLAELARFGGWLADAAGKEFRKRV